jgi:hypothetical protein
LGLVFVEGIRDDKDDTVLLRCKKCLRSYKARNPAESVGKHFLKHDRRNLDM